VSNPPVKTRLLSAALVLAGVLAPSVGFAAQKPPALRVSVDKIEQAIQAHILEATKAGDGYFRVPFQGKTLELKLVRVHTEYLADLGGGVQFACVDLVGTDGPVYDVDFFMKGLPGPATVTETTVHKIDGQPIYAWDQKDDGTWVRVPVTEAPDKLLGVIRGTDEFEFDYQFKVPPLTGPAKLWVPLAQSDAFQTVRVEEIKAPASRRELDERAHGNKVLYMTLGPEDAGSTVEIRYGVKRIEKTAYAAKGGSPQTDLDRRGARPEVRQVQDDRAGGGQGKADRPDARPRSVRLRDQDDEVPEVRLGVGERERHLCLRREERELLRLPRLLHRARALRRHPGAIRGGGRDPVRAG